MWPVRAGLAAAAAIAIVLGVGVLAPRLTPQVDATELMNAVQNASEIVPAGSVRHIITSYTMSPAVDGKSSRTIEQWFGNVEGKLVTHQNGLLGETTVIDSTGTRWTLFPSQKVVMKVADGGNLPLMTPNRLAMSGIGADGSQPRVTGHTTVNGKPATILELTRTLPSFPLRTGNSGLGQAPAGIGVRVPGPNPSSDGPAVAMFMDAGATVLAIPPGGGGMSISNLTVDDQTRQILAGHAVSKDASGAIYGTTDWSVTTDETKMVAQASSDLFAFTPPAGATVQEVTAGQPFQISIPKP